MALTLNGTTGISGIAGSEGTPALQGNNDTNTGYFFATDTLGFSTAGSQRLGITSGGNLTFGNQDNSTAVTATALRNIHLGKDYWNGVKGSASCLKLRLYYMSVDDAYGIGLSNSELELQSQGNIGFYAGGAGSGTGQRNLRLYIKGSDGRIGINTSFTTYGTLNIKPLASGDHGAINVENSTQGVGQSNIVYRSVDLGSTQWAEAVLKANSHKFTTGATERLNLTSAGLQLTAENAPGSLRVNTSLETYGVVTVRDAADANTACFQAENGTQGADQVNLVIRSVDLGSNNWAGARYNALYHQFNRMTTEVARVDDTGLVLAQGKGINFGAQAGSSNPDEEILDHYEEGTWTPTFTAAGSGSDAWSVKYGKYTRIGNRVTATFSCQSYSGDMTGNVGMSGLPFTVVARQYHGDYGTYKFNWPTNNYGSTFIFTNSSNTTWDLYWDKDNAVSLYCQGEYFVAGSYFEGNIHYRVA